ncbi:MAG: hypothetical protein OEY79_04000 [Anaplasmataceae bacterium]|nr:hypothetical protein [Anaplasmataceae bacterium]
MSSIFLFAFYAHDSSDIPLNNHGNHDWNTDFTLRTSIDGEDLCKLSDIDVLYPQTAARCSINIADDIQYTQFIYTESGVIGNPMPVNNACTVNRVDDTDRIVCKESTDLISLKITLPE